MFKSKALNIVFLIMAVLTLTLALLFFYLNDSNHKAGAAGPPSIDEVVKHLSVDTDEMTTNLKDDQFIRIKFTMQVSNQKAKDELTKRQFQVKNTILYLLSNMSAKNLEGQNGLKDLESTLQQKLNLLMKSGKIVHVYTTEKIIQ